MRYDDMGVCKWDTTPYCHEIIGTDRDKWGNTCKTWRRLDKVEIWETDENGLSEENMRNRSKPLREPRFNAKQAELQDPWKIGFCLKMKVFLHFHGYLSLAQTVGFWWSPRVFGWFLGFHPHVSLGAPGDGVLYSSPRRSLAESSAQAGGQCLWLDLLRPAEHQPKAMMGSWWVHDASWIIRGKKKNGWFPKGPCLKIGLIQVVRPSVLLFFNVFQLIDLPVSDEQGYMFFCCVRLQIYRREAALRKLGPPSVCLWGPPATTSEGNESVESPVCSMRSFNCLTSHFNFHTR